MYHMRTVRNFLFGDPHKQALLESARESLKFVDPAGYAANRHDYPAFLQVLDYLIIHHHSGRSHSVADKHFPAMMLTELSLCEYARRGDSCFLAELFKRGAKADIPESYKIYVRTIEGYTSIEGHNYAVVKLMSSQNLWAVRLLAFNGANFDLASPTAHNHPGKTARTVAAETLTAVMPCLIAPSSYTPFEHFYFGPLASGKLLSQQLSFLTGPTPATLANYLAQVEREVADMRRLKAEGDAAFLNKNYQQAVELYRQAGEYIECFSADHAQLFLYYLSMALPFYQDALLSYEQLYGHNQTSTARQLLINYAEEILTHINEVLAPRGASEIAACVESMAVAYTKHGYAFDATKRELIQKKYILIEQLKTQDSAVLDDINRITQQIRNTLQCYSQCMDKA